MQEKTMTHEHFKQSNWVNFFVGSEGTIINQTGCKLVKNFIEGSQYVGIEAHGKKYMKKLSTLVMEIHIRDGRKLSDDMTVGFIDGDPRNCNVNNLKIIPKNRLQYYDLRPFKVSKVV